MRNSSAYLTCPRIKLKNRSEISSDTRFGKNSFSPTFIEMSEKLAIFFYGECFFNKKKLNRYNTDM